ncbi:MAG: hypothetical protein ACP5E3_08265, partial [Bacteroidales bacterium]
NEDSLVSIVYFGEVRTDPAGELFQFDPVSEDFALPNPTNGVIDLFSGYYKTDFAFKMPLFLSNTGGSSDLDSVLFSNVGISISDIVFPPALGEITLTIPGLKSDGVSFTTTLTPEMNHQIVDIADYTLELTSDEEMNNLIDVEFEVYYPRQNKILYATRPLVEFSFYLNFRQWNTIYGYLGNETINFQRNSFFTDFDNNFPDGEFFFQDPSLRFRTRNSYDIPIAMGLSSLYANTDASGIIELEGPGVPVPPDYFYPAYPDNSNGIKEALDSLILDKENSNLKDITASEPQRIVYDAFFETNYSEEKIQNIIFSESEFNTRVDLHLPFYGRASKLAIRDTLAVNFSEFDMPVEDIINQAIFKLYYENTYPADIKLQLYLANRELVITDTLFEDFSSIPGARPTNSYQENPEFVSGEIEASIPGSEIEHLREARYIIGEARLTTVGERDDIKIFTNQGLFMRLAVIFDISTNIEDF